MKEASEIERKKGLSRSKTRSPLFEIEKIKKNFSASSTPSTPRFPSPRPSASPTTSSARACAAFRTSSRSPGWLVFSSFCIRLFFFEIGLSISLSRGLFLRTKEKLTLSFFFLFHLSTPKLQVNVDFADVRAVMTGAGSSLMGQGTGTGKTRARDAALAATSSPLLDVGIERARGIVWNVTGPPDMSLAEVNAAAEVRERGKRGERRKREEKRKKTEKKKKRKKNSLFFILKTSSKKTFSFSSLSLRSSTTSSTRRPTSSSAPSSTLPWQRRASSPSL